MKKIIATLLCVVGALSLSLNVSAATKENPTKEQIQYMMEEPGGH
ncbi:hypothetical protein [Bacillus cereus]|nr:hypothetical protein [Bacillus cereus]